MHLKHIYLRNFRNLHEVKITFSETVNGFVGDNAQGKTNLLEAIFFLSTGRSFRTTNLKQLILQESEGFYISAAFEKDGVQQTVQATFNGIEKKLQINGTKSGQFAPLMGLLPVVLYAPEDVALLSGGPALRRRFLNMHIAQTDPLYIHHLGRYQKAMKQRNELLRSQTQEAIEPWEEAMTLSGTYLMEKRRQALSELEPLVCTQMERLSGEKESLTITYSPSLSFEEGLAMQWQKARERDLHVGTTEKGPHRDEILFSINEMPARIFASIGQRHTLLAALRLAEWKRLHALAGSPPLFCLDDFGSHLDPSRQRVLQNALKDLGQIFITAPSRQLLHGGSLFKVTQGNVNNALEKHGPEEMTFHQQAYQNAEQQIDQQF